MRGPRENNSCLQHNNIPFYTHTRLLHSVHYYDVSGFYTQKIERDESAITANAYESICLTGLYVGGDGVM